MNWFFSNQTTDERIVTIQNKIYREIYYLILVICTLSIVVKFFLHGIDASNVVTEIVILVSQGIYYTIRSSNHAIFSGEMELHDQSSKTPMNTKNVITGVLFGIGIGIFFGINSAIRYADSMLESIYYFFLVALISFLIYVPFFIAIIVVPYLSAKKRSEKVVAQQLNDDENWDDKK